MSLTKQEIKTQHAPPPSAPYSQGLRVGDFLFLSGQRPTIPETGEIVEGFQTQVRQCLLNLESVLKAGGGSLEDLVKVNVYLSDIKNFDLMNEVYREMIPSTFPTRTTISCELRGIMVEIDGIAIAKE